MNIEELCKSIKQLNRKMFQGCFSLCRSLRTPCKAWWRMSRESQQPKQCWHSNLRTAIEHTGEKIRTWWRTSRESQRPRQSWSQGKARRGRQSQRWSPTRSSLATFQILQNKIAPIGLNNWNEQLTKNRWVTKKDIHDGNVLLISIVGYLILIKSWLNLRFGELA